MNSGKIGTDMERISPVDKHGPASAPLQQKSRHPQVCHRPHHWMVLQASMQATTAGARRAGQAPRPHPAGDGGRQQARRARIQNPFGRWYLLHHL